MGCLKCRGTSIDICHKPKASDQQLDMLHNMIKCLCKCGDAEDNIGGGTDTGGDSTGGGNSDGGTGGGDTDGGTGTGGEEPTTPIINTEWVVSNVTVGSSCGKCLIQASRTKDNIKVFSDIEVIPDVQQVSNEIIAGNYGTEVNNAVLAIDPEATDWVLDPANNRVKYSVSGGEVYSVNKGDVRYPTQEEACRAWVASKSDRTYVRQENHRCYSSYRSGSLGNVITDNQIIYAYDSAPTTKYISIDAVAEKVISDAEACNTTSENRLFNIVMSLAHSGFYNDLFEDNIL